MMAEKRKPQRSIKFKILENISHIDIVRDGKTLRRYQGNEVEGKSNKEFQELVGADIGTGRCYRNIYFNNGDLDTAPMNAVNINTGIKPANDDSKVNQVLKEFDNIKALLNKSSSQTGFSSELVLSQIKSGYDLQINFLNQQLDYKNTMIAKLEKETDELNDELDKCESDNTELQGKSNWIGMLDQYKPLILGYLNKKGANVPVVTLGSSEHDSIPKEILDILALVDYVKLKAVPEKYEEILNILRQYISILPQKM